MATNLTQQLDTPASPNLGTPGVLYDERYFSQTNGGLNVYFTKLRNLFGALLGPRGGKWINNPYGAVQRNTDFNWTTANTAQLITCTTEDYLNGMTLDTVDGLHVTQSGIYNYQFSIQFANTDSQAHTAYIWLKVNSTDVIGTGSKFDVPSKHGSSDGYLIGACNFYVALNSGDHIELWGAASQVENGTTDGIYLEAYAAQTSPFIMPSVPSVVATLSFVSNLSTETA